MNEHASNNRVILHCDLDAFFASVEQLDDPSLRGKPVLVGGTGSRGVVCAASYEARVFGCRSAMPMSRARRLCPAAIVVKPRGERYRELSHAFMSILESYSPLVEPLSVDEAFVDVTGAQRLFGDGRAIATAIRARTRDELSLTVSIGVAPNKFVAKLASDLDKPDGLVVFEVEGLAARLAPLDVGRMWGVGPRTLDRCRSIGIRTFADLQQRDPQSLEAFLGSSARRFTELSRGEDVRAVVTEREAKSISQERTFGADLTDPAHVESVLLGEVEEVAARLRRASRRGRRATVKIRFGDFETITRSRTLTEPTDSTDDLWLVARERFREWSTASFRPVRLIGFGVADFGGGPSGVGDVSPLFESPVDVRHRAVDKVSDAIRDRFGKDAIGRAGRLRVDRGDGFDDEHGPG